MIMEATPGIEPGYADLQSAASPLRHVASTHSLQRLSVGGQWQQSKICYRTATERLSPHLQTPNPKPALRAYRCL